MHKIFFRYLLGVGWCEARQCNTNNDALDGRLFCSPLRFTSQNWVSSFRCPARGSKNFGMNFWPKTSLTHTKSPAHAHARAFESKPSEWQGCHIFNNKDTSPEYSELANKNIGWYWHWHFYIDKFWVCHIHRSLTRTLSWNKDTGTMCVRVKYFDSGNLSLLKLIHSKLIPTLGTLDTLLSLSQKSTPWYICTKFRRM